MIHTLHWIGEGVFKQAATEFINLELPDQPELAERLTKELGEVATMQDLAFYLQLSALMYYDREALREVVLKSKSFSMLSEFAGEAATMIENYLNGDYSQFYLKLKHIRALLKYDPYFGEHAKGHQVFNDIRGKALRNYLSAFKVISVQDVANEFGESTELLQ